MQSRMTNPVFVVPEAHEGPDGTWGLRSPRAACRTRTLELVRLRASQINGCSLCVEMHARDLKKAGEKDERLVRRSQPGARRPTSPTPSARRWRSPRRQPGSTTAPTR